MGSLLLFTFRTNRLEGQIISLTRSIHLRSSTEGVCHGRGHGSTSHSHGSASDGSHIAVYLPSTDVIVPTAIVFTAVDIERYSEGLAQLNIKLRNAISTKHIEHHLARILLHRLEHILLNLPLVASL